MNRNNHIGIVPPFDVDLFLNKGNYKRACIDLITYTLKICMTWLELESML
jgi:hypothetical protein